MVLSAWLHYLLGTTLAQIIDVFNFHLQFKLSSGGLVQMWQRLREILLAWYLEIQTQALDSAVLHADETGWRVNGKTHWLWCFATKDVTYYMIDRSRGSPGLEAVLQEGVRRGVGDRLLGGLQRGRLRAGSRSACRTCCAT